MIRKLNFSALTMILAMLLVSTAVSESGLSSGSEEFDRTRLPLMWEPLDRPQISSKQSGSQKLSSIIGAPEADAVWACSSQWLSGINWGGETFSGSISKGLDFFGSNITDSEYVKVQLIFESDTSKQTLCQTFRRDLGYIASGVGTFPGSAWDMSDTLNPRR